MAIKLITLHQLAPILLTHKKKPQTLDPTPIIWRLYHNSTHFSSGDQAILWFQKAFLMGAVLYFAYYQQKVIACLASYEADGLYQRNLQHLIVDPDYLHQNFEAKLIKLVVDAERRLGHDILIPNEVAIHRILLDYDLL